jgi:hypothetical protein
VITLLQTANLLVHELLVQILTRTGQQGITQFVQIYSKKTKILLLQ